MLLFAECALPFRLADHGSFKKLLVDCCSKLHLTLADVGGQKTVRDAINSRAGLDMLDMPAMQKKIRLLRCLHIPMSYFEEEEEKERGRRRRKGKRRGGGEKEEDAKPAR